MIRAPQGARRLAVWRRYDLRRLLLGDVPLKAVAVAVAVVLFAWASAVYRPPAREVTVPFEGRIPVERPEVPPGFVLRGSLGDVGVRLRGPEDVVRGIGQQHLRATVDLSGVAAGHEPQEAPVRVSVSDERVRVIEAIPATVSLRLERRVERVLAVQARFANAPPAGFQASPATFRPQEVTVSGPESAVAAVAAVLAVLRFGDAPLDLAQDARPVPVDANGEAVEGVAVDPVAVQVTVPVVSSATTRTVPIQWRLAGQVATGYWISRITTDPLVATVSGERSAIAALESIETAPVDVTGLTSGRGFVAALAVPEGISVLGETEARVTVTVVALVGTRPFPLVAVRAVGLSEGLTATIDPPSVSVILAGTVAGLSALGAADVSAIVDVTGRGPGTYTLDVQVSAPGGVSVDSVQPPRVSVTIASAAPPPSPSP